MRRHVATIEEKDVGRLSTITRPLPPKTTVQELQELRGGCGVNIQDLRLTIFTGSAIGPIQAQDVGKRVYTVDGIIQVENDNQRDARLATT